MSTSSISSGLPTDTALPALTNGLQITGLASGLNTDSIIQALMQVAEQPVNMLTAQENAINAENSSLTGIQTSLQSLALSAQALGDPTLFSTSQAVTSSNPSIITATSATGAGIGGYQVQVSQLANSAQRTFSYASPSANDTITIDGQQETITAGESIHDFVNQINSDSNADVYAAATDSGTVVLSSRSTGDTGTNFIQVSDPNGTLTEQTAKAKQGQNAMYSVDGVAGTSSSNTVTGAIAGVSLTLNGVTTNSSPVTVDVQPPAPSPSAIQSAVNSFVQSYNSTIQQIQTQLTTAPPKGQIGGEGSLFGDSELTNLLNDMRTAMYAPLGGLPSTMSSPSNIGISTGAATGSGAVSQNALSGQLTVNQDQLAAAIQSNPTGVEQMLQQWSQSFSNVVNNEAGPGGALDARIQGNSSEVSSLKVQIDAMNANLTDQQNALVQKFAALEATMSQSQAQGSWLSGQATAIAANSSAAVSSSSSSLPGG